MLLQRHLHINALLSELDNKCIHDSPLSIMLSLYIFNSTFVYLMA